MDLKTYSDRSIRLAPQLDFHGDLQHATLGMLSEIGEVADMVKKQLAAGKGINLDNLREELGDIVWYLNLAIVRCGFTWDEVLEANNAKLSARYPEGRFLLSRSENRDTHTEMKAVHAATDR